MRHIRLTEQEEQELKELYKRGRYIIERKRSQCLLLSHQGKTINELVGIFGVSRLTITNWLDKWKQGGLKSIQLESGRGRKQKLAGIGPEQLEAYVAEHSRNLNAVVALIQEKHAVVVSKKTLQRFLKTERLLFPKGSPQFEKQT
jgi:transposase